MNPSLRKWSNRASCQKRSVQVGTESKLIWHTKFISDFKSKTLKYVAGLLRTLYITVVGQDKLDHAFGVDMSHVMNKPTFRITKVQISFAVTAMLISAFVFAIRIVQFHYFLHAKFSASGLGLC